MANEPRDDMRAVWQEQPPESAPISLTELRRKARSLHTTVRWRNLREYAGAALGGVTFGYYLWRFPTPLMRVGAALSIAGVLYVMYQLHKRGAARILPAEMARNTCLDFHRRELERQRDLLRSVWRWYLLPLVPGLALFLLGMAVEQLAGRWLPVAVVGGVCALGFFLVGKLNQSAARKLQDQIDALATLEKEPR